MDIHSACMRAASHIEAHPDQFMFIATGCPESAVCGSPGCALGWIGTFMGLGNAGFMKAAMQITGEPFSTADVTFYGRMDDLNGSRSWRKDAVLCARTLRAYAAKYHAPAQRTDSELVADLMARVCGERIAEEA